MNTIDTLTMMEEIKRLNTLCRERGKRMNELSELLHDSICALRFYQSVLGEKIDNERYKKYQSIMINKGFPETPGLYIAQRDYDVVLIKITGMYPTLELGKCINITSLICGNTIKEASKEVINSILLFSDKWKFTMLKDIDMRVFPKTSFKTDGNLDLSTDERLMLRNTYYRMVQSGVSSSKIIRALMYEYKTSMEQVINLLNKFDHDSNYVV